MTSTELVAMWSDAYESTAKHLADAVRKTFPTGSWARKRGVDVVGKVYTQAVDGNPSFVGLMLEHDDWRAFRVIDLEPCERPAWAEARGVE